MLNYLVDSTEQLMSMMLMIGLILAYVENTYASTASRRTMKIGLLVGLLLASAMAIVKNTTSLSIPACGI